MTPATARLPSGRVHLVPLPAAALQPACHIPQPAEIRAYSAGLLLRRAALTLVEIACIGVFVGAVWLWSVIAAGG